MPAVRLPRHRRRVVTAAGAAAVLVAVQQVPAHAHEKWFVPDPEGYPTQWAFAARPVAVAGLLAVLVVAVVWRRVARALPAPELPFWRPLGALAPYVPRLLAVHVGVSLLAAAVSGTLFTPDVAVRGGTGSLVTLAEGLVGVWFITGVRIRVAAVALAVGAPAALIWRAGPVAALSTADLVGIATFLAVLPPGDDAFGKVDLATRSARRALRRALLSLRLGVGTALITLAFAEKLANPALARQTLQRFPELDVPALVGVHLPTDTFVTIAGCTEVLFGLLVVSGALPQIVVHVAWVPFNATLILFGSTEMLGHLPVYGVFLTLLVYGSNPLTARDVAYLPSLLPSGARGGRGAPADDDAPQAAWAVVGRAA